MNIYAKILSELAAESRDTLKRSYIMIKQGYKDGSISTNQCDTLH